MHTILVAMLVLMSTVTVSAQVVESIGFYSEIIDTADGGSRRVEPRRAIQNNSTVSLEQLPSRDKRRTVYVAATFASEASSQVVFAFRRAVRRDDDRCSAENDQITGTQQLGKPGFVRDVVGTFRLLVNNAIQVLEGVEFERGSLKLKVVTVQPNLRTYYDYRFIHCPGLVQVWVTDKEGNVLGPGDRNPGIALSIAE